MLPFLSLDDHTELASGVANHVRHIDRADAIPGSVDCGWILVCDNKCDLYAVEVRLSKNRSPQAEISCVFEAHWNG